MNNSTIMQDYSLFRLICLDVLSNCLGTHRNQLSYISLGQYTFLSIESDACKFFLGIYQLWKEE